MKHVILLLLFGCITLSATDRPNVVFLLVDDLGYGDLACYGSSFNETPNIDRLASEGAKFMQSYSACTVCSPSRAAILTGQYPARLKLTDWISGHKKPWAKLNVPDWKMLMEHDEKTMPEAFQEAGYQTQFIGKWHLLPMENPEIMDEHYPESHGFDHNIAGREWGQPKGRGRYFHPFDMPNLESEEGEYLTDALTDEALNYIESRKKGTPFFLYLSYYTVHTPIMGRPDLVEKYKAKYDAGGWNFENSNDVVEFAGMVEALDESVGRILDCLESRGLSDNTIIVFTSDNGGLDRFSDNGVLRSGKGTPYEGGIRVPLIVKAPGQKGKGSTIEQPVIGTDLYPTLLSLADLPLEPEAHLDGTSLVGLIDGNSYSRETLFWHYPHYHKAKPNGIIRDSNWKLIEYFEDGQLELYDLGNDLSEDKNLAEDEPEKVRQLHRKLQDWRKAVGAQSMNPNPNYRADMEGMSRQRGEKYLKQGQ